MGVLSDRTQCAVIDFNAFEVFKRHVQFRSVEMHFDCANKFKAGEENNITYDSLLCPCTEFIREKISHLVS